MTVLPADRYTAARWSSNAYGTPISFRRDFTITKKDKSFVTLDRFVICEVRIYVFSATIVRSVLCFW